MKFYKQVFCVLALSALVTFVITTYGGLNKNSTYGGLNNNNKNSIIVKYLKPKQKLKYILQWTGSNNVPFEYMGKGRERFISNNCKYTNCFVTDDRNYLGDYTKFDVIAFAGPQIVVRPDTLPDRRSPHQKFVFASIESSHNYPACSRAFEGFFNWTWTFKLDSESKWGYIVVRDVDGQIIGPKTDINWMKVEDMEPVSAELKNILKEKTKTAAWFVSNCYTKSNRERFVNEVVNEMKKYNLSLDIYGACGGLKCPRKDELKCDLMIQKNYHFYFSFENALSEDYVTEKLLHALQYNAVPIVYGGANYSRFMPEGIYLNARELGPEMLVAKMYELMNNKEEYYNYFKWTNHYNYHRRAASPETDDYCGMCAILNNQDKVKEISIYKNFKKWWNSPGSIC